MDNACGYKQRMANVDMESDIQSRILKAIRMGIAISKEQSVRADTDLVEYGIRGVAEGCTREVLFSCGLKPPLINIRPIYPHDYAGVVKGVE